MGPADLVLAIRDAGGHAREVGGLEEAAKAMALSARSGDVVLTLGAGDIGDLAPRMLELMR